MERSSADKKTNTRPIGIVRVAVSAVIIRVGITVVRISRVVTRAGDNDRSRGRSGVRGRRLTRGRRSAGEGGSGLLAQLGSVLEHGGDNGVGNPVVVQID